jgi:hypothetical protein
MLVGTAVEYARSLNARWQSDPGGAILGRPALRWLSYLLILAAVLMIRFDATGVLLSLAGVVVGGFGLILFGCSAVLQAIETGAVRPAASVAARRAPAASAPDPGAH